MRRKRHRHRANSLDLQRNNNHASISRHVKKLGLQSEKDYREWCARHGLGEGMFKSDRQIRKERVKARSMARLVREVDDWHSRLSVEGHDNVEEWEPCGLERFEVTEDNAALRARIQWTIQELRNTALLQVEGRVMGHCVFSYAKRCAAGDYSIWSLRSRVDAEEAEPRHVLTIAVDNRRRVVTEARGRFNMQPHRRPSRKQERRIESNYRVALGEPARIMATWRRREGLGYAQE